MQLMFFWMLTPRDGSSISVTDWDTYLSLMAWTALLIIGIGAAATGALYASSARRRRIRAPRDLFRPYGCMRWLLLAIPAGIVAGLAAYADFPGPAGDMSLAVEAAISIGMETALLTCLLGYAAILFPGVTPPAFKYRPKEWLFRSKTA